MEDGTNLTHPFIVLSMAINPKWYDTEMTKKRSPYEDREVMKGFWAAVKKIYS